MKEFLYAAVATLVAVILAFVFIDRGADERTVGFTGLFCVIGGIAWPLTLGGFLIVGFGFSLGTAVMALKQTLDIGQRPRDQ